MLSITVALLILMALGVTASSVMHHSLSTGSPSPSERPSFYRIAYMAGGRARVAEVAVAYLAWAGLVEARFNTGVLALRSAPSSEVELTPVERALLAMIPPHGAKPTMAMSAARGAAGWVEAELTGLVIPTRRAWIAAAPALVTAVISMVVSLGVLFGVQGAAWDFLPVVSLVALIVGLIAVPRGVKLTSAGREVLDAERERFDPDLRLAEMGVTSLPIESGLYIVALYGRESMTGELAPLARVLAG